MELTFVSWLYCIVYSVELTTLVLPLQVCVSECPTANEFGVRSNPVCVDEVDTSRFTNISVDFSSVSSVSETSSNVAVSY